jgi:hypothetical protein
LTFAKGTVLDSGSDYIKRARHLRSLQTSSAQGADDEEDDSGFGVHVDVFEEMMKI